MMRSQVVGVKPRAPDTLTIAAAGDTATLAWADKSANETGFVIQRATDGGFTTGLTSFNVGTNVQSYADKATVDGTYYYRVMARNVVGDTHDYTDPLINEGAAFPTLAMDSAYSNVVKATLETSTLAAPTNLQASYANRVVTLNWGDASTNESGYVVKRATVSVDSRTGALVTGAYASLPTATSVLAPNLTTFANTNVATNVLYSYQVGALKGAANGPVSEVYAVSAAAPAAPGGLMLGTRTATSIRLSWSQSASTFVTGYEIERCTGTAAACAAAGATWTPLDTVVGRSNSRYNDTGLTSRTTYWYRVRSIVAPLPGFVSIWRTAGGTTR